MEPSEGNTRMPRQPESVSTRQARIAELSRRHVGEPLTHVHRFIDMAWLREAYWRVRKDAAVGIDGESWEAYGENLEANLQNLLGRVKGGAYRAPAVRRVYIPKGTRGETRPIGIPTLEDKVLQRAVVMVLEPILEGEFHAGSFGYRAGRNAHQALARIRRGIMEEGGQWILEVDIRKFFDTLDHGHLRTMVRRRVRDGVVTRLIDKWLKAGVMEDGRVQRTEEGTPQGGVISPVLANLYLHEVLDTWMEKTVAGYMRGRWLLTRFADDFIIGCEKREDAEMLLRVMPKRFGKYGLTLHPEKTRLVEFGRPVTRDGRTREGVRPGTFDFLGFTHHWILSRRGLWEVQRKTARDRFSRGLARISAWLRQNRHMPTREQHRKLVAKMRGHQAYYGIVGNQRSQSAFMHEVLKRWRYWLNRRGGKHRITWERFWTAVSTYFRMPMPRLIHIDT